MPTSFSFLFQYLEKEKIAFDKTEFEFQIQSHPNYPSLLSIADTLSFFNIENGAIHVDSSEIELLPDRFITLFDEENKKPELYFIEKREENYVYTKNKILINISKKELESKWNGIVLLVEKARIENEKHSNKNKWHWTLPVFSIILFLLTLYQFDESIKAKLFFIFPIIGILFSVAALKDLFGTKSVLLNSFCNITSSTSCTSIIDSKKWKIFELVNFSDLSIVFFTSQFFSLFTFLLIGNTIEFFSIQKVLIFGATPILFVSLYYQKFVEKKWCPICLVIITIILIELGYIYFFLNTFAILLRSIVIVGLVFLFFTSVWTVLKKLLTQQKELKEFQLKGNRFMRNYEIFKNALITSTPIENTPVQSGNILLGNVDASLKIIVITSPFCGYCEETHLIMEEILQNHYDEVCFDVRFNFNAVNSDEKSKKIHQQLVAIYHEQGQEYFMKALHNWFKNKNGIELNSYLIDDKVDGFKISTLLDEQFNWNRKNDLTYTPAIIINQFVFPKQYERKELIHFINDLSDDDEFYR